MLRGRIGRRLVMQLVVGFLLSPLWAPLPVQAPDITLPGRLISAEVSTVAAPYLPF